MSRMWIAMLYGLSGLLTGPAQDCVAQDTVGFPLAVGNLWEYQLTASSQSRPIEPATLPLPSFADWTAKVTWEIVAEDAVLGQHAFHFLTTETFLSGPDSGTVASGESWFAVRGDTLQAVASRGGSSFSPVFVQLWKPVVQTAGEEPPEPWHRNSLLLPLQLGQAWNSENFAAELIAATTDTKTVEALETVAVPAGSFDAFRVAYSLQGPDFNQRTEQWFADVGLVRTRTAMVSSQTRTDERGNVIGPVEVTDASEMLLVQFHLVGAATLVQASSWGGIKRGSR